MNASLFPKLEKMFYLGTPIVACSPSEFPSRTGEPFLQFMRFYSTIVRISVHLEIFPDEGPMPNIIFHLLIFFFICHFSISFQFCFNFTGLFFTLQLFQSILFSFACFFLVCVCNDSNSLSTVKVLSVSRFNVSADCVKLTILVRCP